MANQLTVDQAIVELQKLSAQGKGQHLLACWPYDGQLPRATFADGVGFRVDDGQDNLYGSSWPPEKVTRPTVWFEHED